MVIDNEPWLPPGHAERADDRLAQLIRRVNLERTWRHDEATDIYDVLNSMLDRINAIERRLESLPDD